jgi:hypothetical protein
MLLFHRFLQDHLLAVKARLLANMEAAVEQENEEGNKRLQTKQASKQQGCITASTALQGSTSAVVFESLGDDCMHRTLLLAGSGTASRMPDCSSAACRQRLRQLLRSCSTHRQCSQALRWCWTGQYVWHRSSCTTVGGRAPPLRCADHFNCSAGLLQDYDTHVNRSTVWCSPLLAWAHADLVYTHPMRRPPCKSGANHISPYPTCCSHFRSSAGLLAGTQPSSVPCMTGWTSCAAGTCGGSGLTRSAGCSTWASGCRSGMSGAGSLAGPGTGEPCAAEHGLLRAHVPCTCTCACTCSSSYTS